MGGGPEFFFFDLGNVIVTFDHEIAWRQMGRLIGQPADVVRAAIFSSGLQQKYELGEVTERQFHEQFCRATGGRPDLEALLRAGREIFTLNPRVMSIVAQLHAAGHRLGILSDTCPSHWRYLAGGQFPGIDTFFSLAVLSFETRCAKPDPAIYHIAARRAGVSPARIFFVDDRRENVAGARGEGWDAVVFQGVETLVADLRRRGVNVHV